MNKASILVPSFFNALGLILILSTLPFAFSQIYEDTVIPPADLRIKDTEGNILTSAPKGELVMISTDIRNDLNRSQSYVVVLEARDEEGATRFLGFAFRTLGIGEQTEVGISWIPHEAGKYQLRTFTLTSLEDPSVLSPVSTGQAIIVDPLHNSLVITLERTGCFGFCPAYSLTIYGDGVVEYEGHYFVAVKGNQTANIAAEQVQRLLTSAIEIKYFNLADEYYAPIEDVPTYTTSITVDGTTKKIVDYAGAPDRLREFENMIDDVAGSDKWVKCPDGRMIMDRDGGCT